MIIKKSKKLGLVTIFPKTNFLDKRGQFIESFNQKEYKKLFNLNFIEDDFSMNKKNVFRGIHGDKKTWKLFSCIYGKCESIIVNCNRNSKNFGLWEKFILSPKNYFQILIPPSFGNSFLVLSEFSVCHYKQTSYYEGVQKQFTYNYKDPKFKIKLSYSKPILSKRDMNSEFVK
jgi:dTDP-4-dehydrorhamnose 3,5-epimerase